jgi:DNA polymerase V
MLADLIRFEDRPLTLFDVEKPKSASLMSALDQVNNRFGKKTLVLASEGMKLPLAASVGSSKSTVYDAAY